MPDDILLLFKIYFEGFRKYLYRKLRWNYELTIWLMPDLDTGSQIKWPEESIPTCSSIRE
jgi:hypothetical protein